MESVRSGARQYPLSFSQERLWFLDQLEPQNPVYNICKAERIEGPLNIVALEASLATIVNRHAILRTSFPAIDGVPLQIVHDDARFVLEQVDLNPLHATQKQAEVERIVSEEARTGFEFAEGPLFRTRLLVLGPTEFVWLFTVHQMIWDGWSFVIFYRELATLYEHYICGTTATLSDLRLQFADYAVRQRDDLQGELLQNDLSFWLKRLSGRSHHFSLPADRLRLPLQSYRGARQPFVLPELLTKALKELSRRQGTTLFMTLLAAFNTLLHRYSGQTEIIVGFPAANRQIPENENLIGPFVNTLVLNTTVDGHSRFTDLLSQMRSSCLAALAHQELPFEKLVEDLRPERSLNHNPLFQVFFAFQQTASPGLSLQGVSTQSLEVRSNTSKFDLTLSLAEHNRQLVGFFEFSTDLFDSTTIERMGKHFQRVLEAVVADPSESIATLPLLTSAERQQSIIDWNITAADYPRDKCIHQLFEEQVDQTPDTIALEFEERRITFRELNQRANRLARYLITLGIGPEKLVGICIERSVEMVVGLLAILKAGGAYVPLDPTYPKERLRFMSEDSQISALLTQKNLFDDKGWSVEDRNTRSAILDSRIPIVCLNQDAAVIEHQSSENPSILVASTNLAYVIYTSGSTGQSKGVQVEHRSVVNCLTSIGKQINLTPDDIWIAVTSISFDIAALELFLPLITGTYLVLTTAVESSDATRLSGRIKTSGANLMQATPSMWQLLFDAGWQCPARFRVLSGGEALARRLANRLLDSADCAWNLYGPTESTIWSTMASIAVDDKPVSIGRPIDNTQVYILDAHLQPLSIGIPGELYIGGVGLARGYLNRPDLTADKFIRNPFSDDPNSRLYRTGDLAKYRPDGDIEYLGRTDNQVKIRGHRIELGEIESVLMQHSEVSQTVVSVFAEVENESENPKSLVAYIVGGKETKPTISELRRFLENKLPHFMIPSLYIFLDALPLTSNGKVDRHALPSPDCGQLEFEQRVVEPRTEIEELIAQVWREVLKRNKIGIYDNFFDLGGHSLLATRVVARLRAQLSIEVSVRLVFEKPTIEGFAQAIFEVLRNNLKIALPIITPRPDTEFFTPSVAQEPLLRLERTFPGSNFFNIPKAYQLEGPLDLEALEWSVNRVIERHEAMRTSFPVINGQCVGYVARAAPLKLPVSGWSPFNETNLEGELRRFTQDWISRPFDLSSGPLFRLQLLRIHEHLHLLLLVMHHIIADASSLVVFLRDLAAFYSARINDVGPSLAPLNVQYSDYIAWQNQLATEHLLAPQLAYWKEQLKEPLTRLQLSSHPRNPSMLNFLISRTAVSITGDLFQSLKDLSRKSGNSLFSILLTGVKVLLYTYSEETDVRVATLVENRHRPETENVIGYFANTLIIRSKLSVDNSFQQLAKQVRDVTLAAYTHQDLPFEAIVRALEQERKLDRARLAQVMFAYQPLVSHPITLGDATLNILGNMIEKEGPELAITSFDLVLALKETSSELIGSLTYNLDLFDERAATKMLQRLNTIFQRIAMDPAAPVSQICARVK